jgi:hypothetical protein
MPLQNDDANDMSIVAPSPHVGHVRIQERLTSFVERNHDATRVGVDASIIRHHHLLGIGPRDPPCTVIIYDLTLFTRARVYADTL